MVKTIRITIVFLVVLSLLQTVFAQESLEIKLPEFVNSNTIDIPINSPPGRLFKLFVNDEFARQLNPFPQRGSETLLDVTLPEEENVIRAVSIDSQGEESSTEKIVKVDTTPPILEINLPETSTQSKITLKGKASEEVELKVTIYKTETEVTLNEFNELPHKSSEVEEKNLTSNGEFSVDLDLPVEKTTKVEIIATDRAGNIAKESKKTLVDTQPPTITSNLAQLNPSYDRVVTVIGQTSEKASVNIYINDELEKAGVLTDANGNFRQEIELKRNASFQVSPSDRKAGGEIANEWSNKIKLEAVDLAGRKTIAAPVEVKYSLCGSGGEFRINWEKPSPTILNPRLMLQGIQTFGIPFNITYTGSYEYQRSGEIKVYPMQLSPSESDKFDEEWIQTPNTMFETPTGGKDILGYTQVQFGALKGLIGQKKDTDYSREKNISEHRKDKECKVPGFGCVRFYLMGELRYTQKIPRVSFNPGTNERLENFDVTPAKTQKFCNKVEVSIDSVRPEINLPSKRLQSTIEKVQTIIEAIDGLLKPLDNVGKGLFYGCIGSSLASWGTQIYETYACEGSWISKLKEGAFNVDVAKAGLCDAVYDKNEKDQKEKNSACNTCQSAVEKNRKLDYKVVRPICERVAGVSAPTLQSYLRYTKEDVREITDQPLLGAQVNGVSLDQYKVNGKLFAGSDCALRDGFKDAPSTAGIERVREIYQKNNEPANKQKCDPLLRPAHPDCCGAEYMKEWGETCGVRSLGFDTFDELKESVCLAEQKEGSNTLPGGAQCNKVWNAVAGFCDKAGQPMPEQIPTGIRLDAAKAADLRARDNMIYLVVIPLGPGGKATAEGVLNYDIKVSYVADTAELVALPSSATGKPSATNSIDANVKTKFMFFDDGEVKNVFFDNTGKLKKTINEPEVTTLKNAICNNSGQGTDCAITTNEANRFLTSVRNIVGTPDKEFIIQPDANLLTSVRCVYLPGIIGWLNRWKQIATHANNCFKTIQTTGDGSPGVCQEFLSIYVCDFVFDMARCFTQKYSEGSALSGTAELTSGGIGDILHAITKGTTVTQQRMRSRYGETAMFKSLFVERKLQHAMCAAAFGLPYDLDVESIYKQSIPEIPIPSQAMLYPCKRRFAGYNPITIQGQKGLTTWIYETTAFVAPGSDLRWWLELKCSTGYKCESKDGFKNGECDCNKLGQEKIMTVRPSEIPKDTLLKDEILDQKLTYVVQASDNSDNAKVRYDRAVLHWESSDPKVKSEMKTGQAECYIPLTGGDAPAFCSFDPIAGSYLCKFGQQQGSIEIKDVKASQDKFYLGQKPSFTVTINQNYPSEIRNKPEENKYLSWELKNEEKVIETGQSTRLDKDGTYTETITVAEKVEDKNLVHKIGVTPFTVSTSKGTLPQNFRNYISKVIFKNNGGEIKTSVSAVLKFYKTGNNYYFRNERFGVVESELRDATFPLHNQDTTNQNANSLQEIELKIENSDMIKRLIDREGDLTVSINNYAGTEIKPCEGINKQPQNWQIIFKVLDADKTGAATNRVSINPRTAQPVEKPVGFEVVCGEAPLITTTTGQAGTTTTVIGKASETLSNLQNKNPESIVIDVGRDKYTITNQESYLSKNGGAPTSISPSGATLADKALNVLTGAGSPESVLITIGSVKYVIGIYDRNVEVVKTESGGGPEILSRSPLVTTIVAAQPSQPADKVAEAFKILTDLQKSDSRPLMIEVGKELYKINNLKLYLKKEGSDFTETQSNELKENLKKIGTKIDNSGIGGVVYWYHMYFLIPGKWACNQDYCIEAIDKFVSEMKKIQ